jgi:hypothetical protein
MHMKIDMNSHLDSILMTVITVGLYYFNHAMENVGFIVTGKIPGDIIAGAVMVSAISTAILNVYKAWQLWKEYQKNKSPNKNKFYDIE